MCSEFALVGYCQALGHLHLFGRRKSGSDDLALLFLRSLGDIFTERGLYDVDKCFSFHLAVSGDAVFDDVGVHLWLITRGLFFLVQSKRDNFLIAECKYLQFLRWKVLNGLGTRFQLVV